MAFNYNRIPTENINAVKRNLQIPQLSNRKSNQYKLQLHQPEILNQKINRIAKDDLSNDQVKIVKQQKKQIKSIKAQQHANNINFDKHNELERSFKHMNILQNEINNANLKIIKQQAPSLNPGKQYNPFSKLQKLSQKINKTKEIIEREEIHFKHLERPEQRREYKGKVTQSIENIIQQIKKIKRYKYIKIINVKQKIPVFKLQQMSLNHNLILNKTIQSVQNKLDVDVQPQKDKYKKILKNFQTLQTKLNEVAITNFKKMDYNQFERPYDYINILDNKVKTNMQKIKNETYRFDNQFIKQRWYTEKVSQLRAQNIKYEQMKSQRKTRIQKGLEPRMLNKLNNEIDKISKLQSIAEIEEFKINYDKYTNENDTILETIRRDFKLDQMDLKYINSFEDFQNKFNSKIHFEIITDAPYMGLYYGKSNYQDTYAFANIRYIKQNGNIIPIGFIIQNQMSSLLESIFEEVMDNGEKYFNRDVSSTDVMLFQNIGVINVQVISSEQIVQKVCKEKDEFYVSEVDSQYDEGYQIGLICRNVGHRYQGNATLEQKFKGSIFFVKNNDHNCLYAAIIAEFIKKSKTVDKKHIFQLGARPYTMATIAFDAGKALQTYLDKPLDKTKARNQYLYYFTHMRINEINKHAEELADIEILIRAE